MHFHNWLKTVTFAFAGRSARRERRGLRSSSGQIIAVWQDFLCAPRVETLEDKTLLSVDPVLVVDLGSEYHGSNPYSLVNVNGTLFFVGDDGVSGRELWKTDGTSAGTTLVKDIRTGSDGSYPRFSANVNGTLYFSANDGVNGYELWKSDGTSAGTTLVKDIRNGSGSSNMRALTNVNGTLFFNADDGVHGQELWKSDGTSAGTTLVKDIHNGEGFPDPRYLENVNGTLFFSANDGVSGEELWKSDGTSAGTTLVKNISAGGSSSPGHLENVNGMLFFTANDGVSGEELWKSDGTSAGTTLVKDIRYGSSWVTNLTNVNGTLFFSAHDGVYGKELWRSDGTSAGTTLVKDITTGFGGSNPGSLSNVNGTLFFFADDGVHGQELWKSDGTSAGTTLVKDIHSGEDFPDPRYLTNVNGTMFFTANDGVHGVELWQSDGTSAGTKLVNDIAIGSGSSYPRFLTNVNGTLYFNAGELWKADVPADTPKVRANAFTFLPPAIVKDILSGSIDSAVSNLMNLNGTLFFSADDGVNGQELWESDGTTVGTRLVKDIHNGSGSSNPTKLTSVNGTLFFIANDGVNGYELWKSDGTSAGTRLVKDIRNGSGSSNMRAMTNVNGTLFFSADDGVNGYELWQSDGTSAGTTLVKDINSGNSNSYPRNLTNVNGTLFFIANDGVNGYELWKSDGTSVGTRLVKDIGTGIISSAPRHLTNVNGTLFFTSNDRELWKSDGTSAGTTLVKNTGGTNLTNVNGTLFFNGAAALWKSDGTSVGTIPVKNLTLPGGFGFTSANDLTNVNGTLFFTVTELGHQGIGATYRQLWKSDGTSVGTTPLPSGLGLQASQLLNMNGTLFFSTSDGVHGEELWRSDGTSADLIKDINSGAGSSNPRSLTNVNGTMFFTANDGAHGEELWSMRVNSRPRLTAFAAAVDTTNEDTEVELTFADLVARGDESDSDGTVVAFVVQAVASGTLRIGTSAASATPFVVGSNDRIDATKRAYWRPAANAHGNAINAFSVVAQDDLGDNSVLPITTSVNVISVADTPRVTNATTRANTQTVSGLVINRNSADGAEVTHFKITNITGGLLFQNDGRTPIHHGTFITSAQASAGLKFTPAVNSLVTGHFTVQASFSNGDAGLGGSPALANITVTPAPIGTSANDAFVLKYSGTTPAGTVSVTISSNGGAAVAFGTFPMSSPLIINGLGGTDSIRVVGTSGADTIVVNSSTGLTMNGASLILSGIENRTLAGAAGSDLYKFDADTALGVWALDESSGGIDTVDFSPTTTVGLSMNMAYSGTQAVHRTNLSLSLGSGATIENATGGSGADTLIGNNLNNTLRGGPGNDTLNGAAGNDLLFGGANNDTYLFGPAANAETDQVTENLNEGTDTLDFLRLTTSIVVNLGANSIQPVHLNRTLRLNSPITFENFIGGSGADTLTGNSLNNTLTGGAGNDRLIGAAGNDLLLGGADHDTYFFGPASVAEADQVTENTDPGIDTLNFAFLATNVVLNLGSTAMQTVHLNRTLRLSSLSLFENVMGGTGNDTLLGNGLANRLTGGNGHNILIGFEGRDILEAGSGRDILIGGPGLDILMGGSGEDILIAGRTTSDTSLTGLAALRTAWISSSPYATRVTSLRAGVGSPSVSLKAKVNVLNDAGEDDALLGGADSDWYFRALDDVITGLVSGELIDVL
jgi:ELWxxDGT repeat protein